MSDLIEPKDLEINDQSGKPRHYRIGKLPYLAGGREVCSQYLTTAAPKVGDYPRNEELARKLLSYVAVLLQDGTELRLKTDELINNHIPDFVTGARLEKEALEHNLGFSVIGKLQEYRKEWAASFPELISKILMALRDALPAQDNAPATNSKPSTRRKTPS